MSSRSSKKNQLQQETTEQARPRTTSTSASDSVVSESYEDASKSSELIHAAKPIKSRVKVNISLREVDSCSSRKILNT